MSLMPLMSLMSLMAGVALVTVGPGVLGVLVVLLMTALPPMVTLVGVGARLLVRLRDGSSSAEVPPQRLDQWRCRIRHPSGVCTRTAVSTVRASISRSPTCPVARVSER